MPQLTDHLLVAVLVVGLPLYAKFIWFPRMHALPERGAAVARSALFAQTIIVEWALFAIALLSWQVYARPLPEIGLAAPGGWRFFIAAGAGVVVIGIIAGQNARLVRDAEFRKQALSGFESLKAMLPRTGLDRGVWVLLSITAGVCEELLYRGVLVWYLGNTMPAPVAWVVAVALFGWGHFYQGRKGMIQTAVVGALMLVLYVISGTLWVSMVLHVVIDVNSGLFGAWIVGRAESEEPESPPAAPAAG